MNMRLILITLLLYIPTFSFCMECDENSGSIIERSLSENKRKRNSNQTGLLSKNENNTNLKPFQLLLRRKKIKNIYIKVEDVKDPFPIPVKSSLLYVSKFLRRQRQSGMQQTGITEKDPIILKQINKEEFELVVESVKNIDDLSQHLSDKNINQITKLYKGLSYFEIREIIPDVALCLLSFLEDLHVLVEWLSTGWGCYLEDLDINSQIKNKVFPLIKNEIVSRRFIQHHSNGVLSVAMSRDGKTIISTHDENRYRSNDYSIKMWNVNTGAEICKFEGHTKKVNSVAFSRDEKKIISASEDGTIKLWDVARGELIKTFTGHEYGVKSVVFSQDKKTIISVSRNEVKVWDVKTCVEVDVFKVCADDLVGFSSDRKIFACNDSKEISVWDVEAGQKIFKLSYYENKDSAIELSPDGKMLAVVCGSYSDYTVEFWNVETSKKICTWKRNGRCPENVKFSPDGKTLALMRYGYIMELFNVETGKEICSFQHGIYYEPNIGLPNIFELGPDGKTIIFGDCCRIGLLKFFDEEELKNSTSVAWFLLLQGIHNALTNKELTNKGCVLKKFPKLLKIYQEATDSEREMLDNLLFLNTPLNIKLDRAIKVCYTNWRGETSIRNIVPWKRCLKTKTFYWGKTKHYEQAQWLLTAWDVDRHKYCRLALKDIKFI